MEERISLKSRIKIDLENYKQTLFPSFQAKKEELGENRPKLGTGRAVKDKYSVVFKNWHDSCTIDFNYKSPLPLSGFRRRRDVFTDIDQNENEEPSNIKELFSCTSLTCDVSLRNSPKKIKAFESQIDYGKNDKDILDACASFYEKNDKDSVFCKLIIKTFIDINLGMVAIRDMDEDIVKNNLSKVLGSGNFHMVKTNVTMQQPTQVPAWKKCFDNAGGNYADGKAAFYTKDFQKAIGFFERAKDGYKEVLRDNSMDNHSKQKAQNRLNKMKKDVGIGRAPGKYSVLNCHN